MMTSLGFHHLAVRARDVERVAAFYRDVLGLPEKARHLTDDGTLRSIWLGVASSSDADAGFLAIERASSDEDSSRWPKGYSMLALRIDPSARHTVEQALQERDIPIEYRTAWTLYVRDPEGNRVGLSHHPYAAGSVP